MRSRLVAWAGMVLIAGSGVVAAAGPGGGRAAAPDPGMLKQELGLSEEQWVRARQIWSEAARERIRRQAAVRLARLDLRELMRATAPDEKAIAVKVKELTDLQAAALKGRVDRGLALKRVLTPEQQDKMLRLRGHRDRPGLVGRRGPGVRRGDLDLPDGPDGPDESPDAWGDDEQ